MAKIGLCAKIFQDLSVAEIIDLATQAKLTGIEWDEKKHIPAGAEKIAGEVAKLSQAAKLAVLAYASTYQVGVSKPTDFDHILTTAVTLSAPIIRVTVGKHAANEIDEATRTKIIADAKRIIKLTKTAGVTLSFIFQPQTVLDNTKNTLAFFNELESNNFTLTWQSDNTVSIISRMYDLRFLKQYFGDIYVDYYENDKCVPLAQGSFDWQAYLKQINSVNYPHRHFLIKSLAKATVEQLTVDLIALKEILKNS